MGSHTSASDIQVVLDSFRRIVRALRLFDREAEKRLGLSGAQVFVLETLRNGEGISINELAARTHTDQSSVSVVIGKLASLKLVARARVASDGRRVQLALTPKGRRLLRSAPAAAQGRLISGLAAMPKTKRRMLGRLLVELIWKTGIEDQPAALFFEDRKKKGNQ